jgi:hypothetical protein
MTTQTVEEIDIVRVDPLFLERERNRYASRAVGYLVALNGIAALLLVAAFSHGAALDADISLLGDGMIVFGAGALAALGSAFFAYLSRTLGIEMPERYGMRRGIRALAVLAAIGSAVCFMVGLTLVARALPEETVVTQQESPQASPPATQAPASPTPAPATPSPGETTEP